MKKIAASNLPQLWRAIQSEYQLYLPIEKNGEFQFSLWQEGDQVNFERLKTVIPPKHFILPQTETYLTFRTEGKKLYLSEPARDQAEYVVFGARACDAAALHLIDNVFLNDPVDRLYEERRNKGIIISMACKEPEETCFCGTFGIAAEKGSEFADVTVWDIGGMILWQPQTGKGQALTDKLDKILEDASEADKQRGRELADDIQEKLKALPLAALKPPAVPVNVKELFEAAIWEDFGQRCLGCGTCTFVCPTCHCYDIQDFDGGKAGERFRCWDSCMFSDFTLMAHGNPRKTQKERFRQRFMHKLAYYPSRYGAYACVGCGRCVVKCPEKLNIVKVINKLGGEAK